MAYFTADLSGAVRQLEKADLFSLENADHILRVGVSEVEKPLRPAFSRAGHNRTGATSRHITHAKKTYKDRKDGQPYMYVTVTGKDKRGQRYGAKAFVLNYGRRNGGKIPASHWWSNSVAAAQPAAIRAMEGEITKILKGD